MATEGNPELIEFAPVEGWQVVTAFDGGNTADAGSSLLGGLD